MDPPRRAQVATALGGGAAATRVAELLDGYADRWRAMRIAACRATRVEGVQSERLLDLRMRCLERRRDQLGALAAVLASAAPTTGAQAIDAAFALPDLHRCADADALNAAVPPPENAALRERVEDLDHRLDRALALQQAGMVPAALAEAQATAADAARIDYPPIRARALFRLGDLQSDAGEGSAAETTLYQAAKAAAIAHDDRLLAESYLALAWVLGYQQARFTDATVLTRVCEAAIAHVGDDPFLRVLYLHRIAILDRLQGRYASAHARWLEALPLAERAYGVDHPRVADLLVSLGNVALAEGQLEQVGPAYERALAIYQRALGAEHPRVTYAFENLGALRDKQGRFEEARGYFTRSLEITERAMGANHPDVGHALLNLAGALRRRLGRLDEARAAAARAVAIEEAAQPDHPDLGLALGALGEVEVAASNARAARPLLARALAILERAQGGDHLDVAQALSGLARVALLEGKRAEACALRVRAEAIAARAVADEPTVLAPFRADLAACGPRP